MTISITRMFFTKYILIVVMMLSFSYHSPAQKGPKKLYPILQNYVRNLYPDYRKNLPVISEATSRQM